MSDEILLYYNEKKKMWDNLEEPFATIVCPTEEDYQLIKSAVEHYRKHARWIKTSVPDVYQCSHCKKATKMDELCDSEILRAFCPNCGVKMDSENFLNKK